MRAIEECAKKYVNGIGCICSGNEIMPIVKDAIYKAYISSGEKQQELFVQYASEWLENCLPNIERQNKKEFIESFIKYMKEKL